jgi:hypothetical protein
MTCHVEQGRMSRDSLRISLDMKTILCLCVLIVVASPPAFSSDAAIFLNAFGETATAYLNDCFLLLGTTADGFVADIIQKDTALDIAANVQKRVRIIRSKLKTVSQRKIAVVDKQLVKLLDEAYACMDHQAWALSQYVRDKSPDTARRFEEQRNSCLQRVEKVAQFYSTLPPARELPEPLSTR